MKKNIILFIFTLLFGFKSNADILDIPEVKVYGERKVKVETINKQALPFEKEYLKPSIVNTKKGLPKFEVGDKKTIKRNIGARIEATAGTYLDGYLLGYARENFQPFEVGLNFNINSITEDSTIQLFSRTSYENFYINGAFYGTSASNPIYRFNIGNIHNIIDFDFQGIFSDSLIGVVDIDYRYSSFLLNLQFGTADIDFNIKALYEKYPFQAGITWFDKKIYPELVYFFPVYDLYLKGSLLNKTGIAHFYCQSIQYIHEYKSSDTYYRVEFGQSNKILPFSAIYSHYLNNSSNYIGIKGAHEKLFFEFEFPLESEYDYILRAGINTILSEFIYTNIYGYASGTDNYFIGADIGYQIKNNLRIGIKTDYIYGFRTEDDLDIGGYLFASF
jgi:hypothetical protein